MPSSNSVIGNNFGAQGPTGPSGGIAGLGAVGFTGPTGATGATGATGSVVSSIVIGDSNQDGAINFVTNYANGYSVTSSRTLVGLLGPTGETVYKLFGESLGTEASVLTSLVVDGCEVDIGILNFKSFTGTGGIAVTEEGNEIFITFKNSKQITGVTGGIHQIAYMGGSAGNSAAALPLVRGATGFSYNTEFNRVSAISRNYKEVGHRFTMNEVSGGSITEATRLVEFNVNPSMRLGITYNQEDPYGSTGPWGNVWYIDVDQLYTSQVAGNFDSGLSGPFVKINDITGTADRFNKYFGGADGQRASAFTLAIKGGSSKPRDDGLTSDKIVFPPNWIFPYGERPVLTEATDIYQFFSAGKHNEKGIVWYGMALKSQPGTDIFFPTY
jgi:hypothetical protein